MTDEINSTETLDVQGLNCPMPVVKTKQTVDDLDEGDVLEVVATDSGSVNDMAGWAENTSGVEMVDQDADDDAGVYTHYVRKTE